MADLYSSMQKRMSAVQSGQPDPGNPDLYGTNQTQGGGSTTPPPIGLDAPSGQPTTSQGVLNSPVPSGPPTTVTGAFQQSLMNRLNPGPVTQNAPEIAGAIGANNLAQQRGAERERAALAVNAANNGLDSSGAERSMQQGILANQAAQQGQFAGNAVMDLAKQRQQELTAALALGGQMLSDQDRLAIQRELAQLDAQVRREGLSVQQQLGQGDLGLREKLGLGQLNLGLLGTLLGNQQAENQLGANVGMFNASQAQQALLGLLGGL